MAARTLVPLLLPGLLAAAVSTGCSGNNTSSAAPGKPQGPPALTKEQAQQVLTSFASGMNQAGLRFSGRTLRTVETDPQLTMDVAALKLRRAVRQRPPKVVFSHTTFYIPRLTGHPRWFAADAVSGKGKQALRHALLFTQSSENAPWLLAADPYPSELALAHVALDPQGYATPVAPDVEDLAVAPAKLPKAHAALLTDGPRASGASVLADGAKTSETYKALKAGEKTLATRGVTLSSRFSPAEYKVLRAPHQRPRSRRLVRPQTERGLLGRPTRQTRRKRRPRRPRPIHHRPDAPRHHRPRAVPGHHPAQRPSHHQRHVPQSRHRPGLLNPVGCRPARPS